jgi:hypothetical protein
MIDNFKLLEPLLQFYSPGDCYFIQLLKRHKDNPDMTKNMVNVDNFFVYNLEDYYDKKDAIVASATAHNARAYIRINRRNTEKLALLTMKKVVDLILSKEYKAVKNAYLSVAGENNSEPIRRWLVDIDLVDAYLSEVREYIKELHAESNGGLYEILLEVPTKNGVHIITNPFNLQKFRQRFPDPIDVHKDNPTLLYQP